LNKWIFICHRQQHKKKSLSRNNSPDKTVRLNTALTVHCPNKENKLSKIRYARRMQ